MDLSILKKFDLSDKEISVYLVLLENGAMSVRGVAEASSLNRGTAYDTLKKLQEKSLVSFFHQKTKQQFAAESPEKLISLAELQEKELRESRTKLAGLIPELKSLSDKGGSSPVTKFYEGRSGIRAISEDVLLSQKKGDEYYVYSAKSASEDLRDAYPDFTADRIKKQIRVKAISLADGGQTRGLDERKWLKTNDDSATFIIIYAGKCAFISRNRQKQPVGVIIENQMIYETQKKIFLQLWGLLPS